jgi:hypothetical protein
MSRRKAFESFEDLLKTDFRWPRKGDLPFAPGTDIGKIAVLAGHVHTRLVHMAAGYKESADILVDQALKRPALRDSLVYPIIFAYRHYIELALKTLIATYGPRVGVEAIWNTHRLQPLWDAFTRMVEGYRQPDPDDADPIVAECLAQFAKIDPDSFSHRYPMTTDGRPLPLTVDRLDLDHLADLMEAIEDYFNGTDGYLDALVDAAPAI